MDATPDRVYDIHRPGCLAKLIEFLFVSSFRRPPLPVDKLTLSVSTRTHQIRSDSFENSIELINEHES